jgi:threonine dehydrogenase-like Zn-dependent dehydrogenase
VGCLLAEGIKNVCIVDMDEWRLQKAAELSAKTINTSNEDLKVGLTFLKVVEHLSKSINEIGQSNYTCL